MRTMRMIASSACPDFSGVPIGHPPITMVSDTHRDFRPLRAAPVSTLKAEPRLRRRWFQQRLYSEFVGPQYFPGIRARGILPISVYMRSTYDARSGAVRTRTNSNMDYRDCHLVVCACRFARRVTAGNRTLLHSYFTRSRPWPRNSSLPLLAL